MDTHISNEFLNKYLSSAPSAYIVVFIRIQQMIQEGKSLSTDEIARSLNMTENDVRAAVTYWKEKGENIELSQKSAFPVDDGEKQLFNDPPKYTEEELLFYRENSKEFKAMIKSAEDHMGRYLRKNELGDIYTFHDYYKLPLDVIELLFGYCANSNHRNMSYINSVAHDWAVEGIRDIESANERIRMFTDVYMKIMRALGLANKTPVKRQIEYMKNWNKALPIDVVLYACEKAAFASCNGNPFPYADTVISNWKKQGVDTLEKVKLNEEKFRRNRENGSNNGSAQQSYRKPAKKPAFNYEQREWDFDELERIKREELLRNSKKEN